MRMLRAALFLGVVVATSVCGAPGPAFAQIGVPVAIAPPLLPVYAQPPILGPGYIWAPGYWAYGPGGYYWVPGTWVLPPAVGLLWTPGYWGWSNGAYVFHTGYWGPQIGYYGGINYGFGYTGVGYAGGYWSHSAFYYNRAVNNFGNTRITNVYNKTVVVNRTTNVSYNGGVGGTAARPTSAELAAAREQHVAPTAAQVHHQQAASADRALQASVNHGSPPVAATRQPGRFTGQGVVAARGAAPVAPTPAGERRATAIGTAARTPPTARQEHPPARPAVTGTATRNAPATARAPQPHPNARVEARPGVPERTARQPAAQQRPPQARAAQRPAPREQRPEQR
jgi:hypothetical protein